MEKLLDQAHMLHTFEIRNRKTGRAMTMQHEAETKDRAEQIITTVNLAGLDLSEYQIAHVKSVAVSAAKKGNR